MTAQFSAETRALAEVRAGGICEICGAARAYELHHRRARGMGSTRRVESAGAANALFACPGCHRLVESHRNLASLLGWLVPQQKRPDAISVLYRGQWARLTDDGQVTYEWAA